MSTKPPLKPPTSELNPTPPPTRLPDNPFDATLSHTPWFTGIRDPAQPNPPSVNRPQSEPALPTAVEVTEIPRQDAVSHKSDDSVSRYWQSEALLRGMKAADADGFRWVVGRQFVDIEYEGTLQTLPIGVDEFGAYRGKLLTERHPCGLLRASTLKEREIFLQSFNLLPSQLARLQQAMQTEPTIPQWALAHKRLIDDVANPQRLDQLARDAIEELNLKRNARHAWYDPELSMTLELREALLKKMGYLRNKYNCLYRTDVPALFRGDDRTPFELANDGVMLPRYSHNPGATTHKPMSATFSLNEGLIYAREPDPEYLRFNRQTNKYPGREAHATPPRSDTSDTESSSDADGSDADSPVPWDHERDYERTRERQTETFLYALDTRHLEVVPREENLLFNSTARDTPTTRFPSDDFEGLISVTKSGLEADRIWLLNSALTKGARVNDIEAQAGNSAKRIEAATHAGQANKYEYDQLINQAEAAGKPILGLSGNKNELGDDIVWP